MIVARDQEEKRMKTEMAFTLDGLGSAYPQAEHAKELTVKRHPGRRLSLTSKYEDGNESGGILSPLRLSPLPAG